MSRLVVLQEEGDGASLDDLNNYLNSLDQDEMKGSRRPGSNRSSSQRHHAREQSTDKLRSSGSHQQPGSPLSHKVCNMALIQQLLDPVHTLRIV